MVRAWSEGDSLSHCEWSIKPFVVSVVHDVQVCPIVELSSAHEMVAPGHKPILLVRRIEDVVHRGKHPKAPYVGAGIPLEVEFGCAYSSAWQKAHFRIEVVLKIGELSENLPTLAYPGCVQVPSHVTGTDGGGFCFGQKASYSEARKRSKRHVNGIRTVIMSAFGFGLVDE